MDEPTIELAAFASAREHPERGASPELPLAEYSTQRVVDRHDPAIVVLQRATFLAVAYLLALHRDTAALEVDIAPLKGEDLRVAQPGEHANREHRRDPLRHREVDQSDILLR